MTDPSPQDRKMLLELGLIAKSYEFGHGGYIFKKFLHSRVWRGA